MRPPAMATKVMARKASIVPSVTINDGMRVENQDHAVDRAQDECHKDREQGRGYGIHHTKHRRAQRHELHEG